jgi:uncharacterized protein with HEPN domain
MPRDARAFVWDAQQAIERIGSFVRGKSWEDYEGDVLLRSAVERQFEIIGEALNRFSKEDPAAAERIPDLPRIVAFRNILIHGYAMVDDRIVWEVVTTRMDGLDRVLSEMKADDGSETGE